MKLLYIALATVVLATPAVDAILPFTWFARIALSAGYRYVEKNAWYCRGGTRYVPAHMDCPSLVFGVGLSKSQAQKAAQVYSNTIGDNGCARYNGHLQCNKWKEGKRRASSRG